MPHFKTKTARTAMSLVVGAALLAPSLRAQGQVQDQVPLAETKRLLRQTYPGGIPDYIDWKTTEKATLDARVRFIYGQEGIADLSREVDEAEKKMFMARMYGAALAAASTVLTFAAMYLKWRCRIREADANWRPDTELSPPPMQY